VCFGVCCSVWSSTPTDYDRSHTSAIERTRDHPTRLRSITVEHTHERTASGRSNASARRSNAIPDRSHALTIDRICERSHSSCDRTQSRSQQLSTTFLFIVFSLCLFFFFFSFIFQIEFCILVNTLFLLY
jgi:hypothetical protein